MIACLSLLLAHSITAEAAKAAAKFESLSGQVQYRSKAGHWQDAKLGQNLMPETELVTGPRAKAILIFPNGSTMALSAFTQVTIDRYGTGSFGTNAEVTLRSGRMIAKISRYKSTDQRNYFRVRTPTVVAGVRGTVQEISYTPDKGTEIRMLESSSEVLDRTRAHTVVPDGGKSHVTGDSTLPADKTANREQTTPMLSKQATSAGEADVSDSVGDFNFSANSSDFTEFLKFYDDFSQDKFNGARDLLILEKL